MTKIVVVGGVAGGMSAATRLRRLMEDAEITVYEKGPYVSFANCGLPYHVSGEIPLRESLVIQTPETLHGMYNFDIKTDHEVVSFDPDKKTVTVKNREGEFVESYDSLILSPGAKPFIPPIEGLDEATNVFSLRNIPDLDKIMEQIERFRPQKAIVVGAGFIGLEMAENLKLKGLDVTIVEKAPHVLPPLDEEMAMFISNELESKKVKVITSQSATKFKNKGRIVVLEDGTEIETDLTIMSVGVLPENNLAKNAGVELGMKGGILVDKNYETNLKDVYAIGDAIIVKQQLTGEDTMIALASPANRHGRQVADIIAGMKRENKGSIGTAIVKVFDLTAGSTGLSERAAKQAGLDVGVVHTEGFDHADYYPGATNLELKLIFDKKSGKIYGAQVVGNKGVDKRIDVLATAIKGDLDIFDLPELELTYAPPFGSAKDPANLIGYAATNLAEGTSENVQWHELETELENGKILIDVREDCDLEDGGRIKGAIPIPLSQLRERVNELDIEKEYIISCKTGRKAYTAERILKQKGFKAKNLDGAYRIYSTVRPDRINR